jgi:bisanhydrobacterioruberin hydratase
MNSSLIRAKWWAVVFLTFFAVGTIGHYVPIGRTIMLGLTPWFLLLFGLLALVPVIASRNSRFLAWGAAALGFTFLLEALGVRTGRIFGAYTYGQTLGVKLFAVPLVIGFNWLIVVAGINSMIEHLAWSKVAKSAVVGTGAVLFDLILEPVAMGLDYWSWEAGSVPLQNYIAWWIIAFAVTFGYYSAGTRMGTRVPGIYVVVQAGFLASLLPQVL